MTPLHFAALGGRAEAVEWLIENRASLSATSKGMTALHMGAISGSEAVVQRLLATRQFDPNSADHQGRTALHFALALDQIPVARQLVEQGADPIAKGLKTTPFALFKALSSIRADARDPLKLDKASLLTLTSFISAVACRYFGYKSAGNFFGVLPIFTQLIGWTRGPIYRSFPSFLVLSKAMNAYLANDIDQKMWVQGGQIGQQSIYLLGEMRRSWKNLSHETYRPIRNLVIQAANVALAAWEMWHTYHVPASHPDFDVMASCGSLSERDCILEAGKDFSKINRDPHNPDLVRKDLSPIPKRLVDTNDRTVLGLKAGHTRKECVNKFLQLSLKYHPDKTQDSTEKALRQPVSQILPQAKKLLCP
jgi:hypothetical protein